MSKELWHYLFIIFSGGAVFLLILSIMTFCNIKGLNISEGRNTTGGLILLINTVLYGIIAYGISVKLTFIKYEEEKNRQLDNFLELPSLNYNFNPS